MVSKDLFLRVHHITSYWRVLVLDWIRQLLRNHAPFDVRRRLHYTRWVFAVLLDQNAFSERTWQRVRWVGKGNALPPPGTVHWDDWDIGPFAQRDYWARDQWSQDVDHLHNERNTMFGA